MKREIILCDVCEAKAKTIKYYRGSDEFKVITETVDLCFDCLCKWIGIMCSRGVIPKNANSILKEMEEDENLRGRKR